MKYVILEIKTNAGTLVYPIIFPESLTHKTIGERMVHALGWELGEIPTIRSAGFCRIHNNEWQATRGSESLGIERDTRNLGYDDYRILNMPNAMQGMWMEKEHERT